MKGSGALGMMDSAAVDYPNYATGLAVRSLVRAKSAGWQTMVVYLRAVLLPPQRPDGSYRNSSNLVKEDDPLIATAFAVRVLKVGGSFGPRPIS